MQPVLKQSLRAAVLAALATALAAGQSPSAEETKEANLKAYVDLLRTDLKKEKVAVLTEVLALSPDEASRFWPLYNEFDKSLTKIGDERIAWIRMYAENYSALNDDKISQIANGLLDLEVRRTQLKKQFFQKLSQATSMKLAARFLQIENQIEKILDLQIASSLPLVE